MISQVPDFIRVTLLRLWEMWIANPAQPRTLAAPSTECGDVNPHPPPESPFPHGASWLESDFDVAVGRVRLGRSEQAAGVAGGEPARHQGPGDVQLLDDRPQPAAEVPDFG